MANRRAVVLKTEDVVTILGKGGELSVIYNPLRQYPSYHIKVEGDAVADAVAPGTVTKLIVNHMAEELDFGDGTGVVMSVKAYAKQKADADAVAAAEVIKAIAPVEAIAAAPVDVATVM